MHALHLFSAILVAASSLVTVQAECCGSGECVSWNIIPGKPGKPDKEVCNRWKCADGHHHGWAGCCGYGRCNVMCCNCDKVGGKVCRVGKESLVVQQRAVGPVGMTDAELFKAANTDGTGNMSLEELAKYLGAPIDDAGLAEKFAKFDRNGDGFLQVDEMRLDDEVEIDDEL